MYRGLIADAWLAWQGSAKRALRDRHRLVVLTVLGIRNAWDLVTFIAPRSAAGVKVE